MDNAVLLFTRNGIGDGPVELHQRLAVKFLSLPADSSVRPAKTLFYTDGVKLAGNGSPALDPLRALDAQGVELILCQTCLDYYGLQDQVAAGVVGGMPDIIEAMRMATKVIAL